MIRIAVGQLRGTDERDLAYAAQLGVHGIQLFPPDPDPARHWTVDALRRAKAACEVHSLVLESVAMHIYSHAMLGLPGGDEELELCRETIRNMGEVGIPILGHDFAPNSVWRTADAPTRGGAMATAFDLAEVEAADAVTRVRQLGPMEAETEAALALLPPDRTVSEDDVWANFERFMGAVLPTAERAGVVLAVHPDDPPVPMLGGIARVLRSPAGFRRAMQVANSPAWQILLCLGTTSEMEGGAAAVKEMIETFGPLGKIAYVHFRDVKGSVPKFTEAFIGDGNYHPLSTLRLLRDNGFDGVLMDDHVPFMTGDSEYGHTARAHAIGYMQGLLAALDA